MAPSTQCKFHAPSVPHKLLVYNQVCILTCIGVCVYSSFHKKLNLKVLVTYQIFKTPYLIPIFNTIPHSSMKSYSLRESLSHTRHAHKVYPKTPAVVKSSKW